MVYTPVTFSLQVEPYCSIRRKHSANDSLGYDGYIVDLMAKISEMLGIEHRLFPVHDGRYGNRRSDGTWNGIIGEVMRKVIL